MVKKTVEDVVKELGRYPIEAFEFLHSGLDYTVRQRHGPPDPGLGELLEWLEKRGVSLADLRQLAEEGGVPPAILEFLDRLGGMEAAATRLNRHVGGEELCWGLRTLALEQWGLMARVVLGHWGIRSTKDFGRMIFALVDHGLLQKEPEDQIEDFDDIYEFDTVFEKTYKISLPSTRPSKRDVE